MSARLVESFKVASTLAAYRAVCISSGTADVVTYPEGNTGTARLPIGVTTNDVIDTNQAIPVQIGGIAKVEMGGSCAVGAFVCVGTDGRGLPFVPASTATASTTLTGVIGVLVGPGKIEVAGAIADVLLHPQLMR